ncbi:hypothetical protein NB545_06050 [Vibrio campbellii]|uniref:hypothetical protein n=1 Tax=Vibrio campbellii TaxID=680 RepID=UPI00215CFF42|nr:hypothetical protein [Vibrio campbellii]MCR9907029.1 hypothetical protein [Vibrio campbellii]
MKKSVSLLLLSFSSLAWGEHVAGVPSQIAQIMTSQISETAGDVMLKLEVPVSGCEDGYFIREGTRGLEEGLSVVLSAYHAGIPVKIDGVSGVSWPGSSSSRYCQVYSISLIKG